jgi:hypothetical protein
MLDFHVLSKLDKLGHLITSFLEKFRPGGLKEQVEL